MRVPESVAAVACHRAVPCTQLPLYRRTASKCLMDVCEGAGAVEAVKQVVLSLPGHTAR